MSRTGAFLTLLLALLLSLTANGQNASKATPPAVPSYRISFERHEAVCGSGGWMAFRMPFECISDGTIFVDFVTAPPANPAIEPPVFPATTLVSISPDGHSQTFRLDQAPKLYSANMSFYATESGVTFLVSRTLEKKLVKGTSTGPDGGQHEFIRNDAERHVYILSFGRDGTYQRSTEVDPSFRVLRLGMFQTGTLLAFGYDEKSHAPKLAMLKEDGTLLKVLDMPEGNAPGSLRDDRSKVLAPTEIVPEGRSILLVQSGTSFPLLEVSEGGAIRAIHPKLPTGMQIEGVIPSDHGLYVIVGPGGVKPGDQGTIYEISPEDGTLLRRFLGDRPALGVACVHDRKFLSIDYAEGKIVPLVGSAESEPTAGQPGTVFPPKN
jgi:hypothetical protein